MNLWCTVFGTALLIFQRQANMKWGNQMFPGVRRIAGQ